MNAPSKKEVEAPWVLREDKEGVATLTLNRGDRMNPLSTAMLSALQAELDRVAKDGNAKLVVLAGAGKHFCAGHDLREMRAHPGKAWQKALFEQCSEMMLSLVRLPQPVIARVLVEPDREVEIVAVGERERAAAGLERPFDQRLGRCGAAQQRSVRADAQRDERAHPIRAVVVASALRCRPWRSACTRSPRRTPTSSAACATASSGRG